MQPSPDTLGRGRRTILVAIPAVYAIVGILHPTENPNVGDPTDLWIALHLVQLALIGGIGWMFWMLVAGRHSRAATVVRALIIPYIVLYTAMDAILGLAWGYVARTAGQLPAADQPAAQRLLDQLINEEPDLAGIALYFGSGLALAAVVAATIVALRDAPRLARWLLGVGGLLFVTGHAPPFGPVAMTLIAVAVAMLTRSRHVDRRTDHVFGAVTADASPIA